MKIKKPNTLYKDDAQSLAQMFNIVSGRSPQLRTVVFIDADNGVKPLIYFMKQPHLHEYYHWVICVNQISPPNIL